MDILFISICDSLCIFFVEIERGLRGNMPTNVTDQFYEFDPASPPPVGTPVSFYKYVLTDQNDDGDIDEFDADAVTGLDVTASWPGDTITIDISGSGNVTYTGTTLYLSDGSIIFTPTDGQVLQTGEFVSSTYVNTQGPLFLSQLGPPCFATDTLIATPSGEKRIQELMPGDRILTADSGPVPVRFVRKRSFDLTYFEKNPRHLPVLIKAGSLGGGLPKRNLRLSPQHRLLARSKVVERMFGSREILVPAAALVGCPGIIKERAESPVTYYHILLDHHHIVHAEGAEAESLLLGRNILCQFSREELYWLMACAPECLWQARKPARPLIAGKRVKRFLNRISLNCIPICLPIGTEQTQNAA